MLTIAEGILLCFATSGSVLGVLGNGFILCANCINCVTQKFSTAGFIFTGLAICRICVICIIMSDGYLKLFSPHMVASDAHIIVIAYLWMITNHTSTWFATSLNLFYLLKIANFSHYIFFCLKRRINTIFIFLLGCLLISWSVAFPQIVKMLHVKMQHRNTSWQLYLSKSEFIVNHILLNLGAIFFFIVSIITCFLLIISLWKHNRKMQLYVSRFKSLKTEVHLKVMKVLISFIILFILHFIGIFRETFSFLEYKSKLLFILGLIISCLYPCCHSFILILANSQLKQASLKALKQFICHKKDTDVKVTW
ncbi:taste receptor type 2 member 106 [Apodemus sylvaticus]|uniref:taste receptor type 2 member 106 n=1 Tax=Apodemus sylvaticus TaxID=10129 RepID=UPI002243DBA0|nr:taste receptor type 2 member 106 [Apodemus sylvaticus]